MKNELLYQLARAELTARGPARGSLWRHRSGGLYVVVALCVLECDLTPSVAYAAQESEPDDLPWVMPLEEFLDGRFTPEAGNG